jgi:hypothetical protein
MRLRGDDMKPTYEELEAQAAAMRQTLNDIKFDLLQRTCTCRDDETANIWCDNCYTVKCIDDSLSSTAGQDLLTRLETLEKALDMVCGKIDSCPSKIEFMKCNLRLNESKCRDCRRVYFINKAGGSK